MNGLLPPTNSGYVSMVGARATVPRPTNTTHYTEVAAGHIGLHA